MACNICLLSCIFVIIHDCLRRTNARKMSCKIFYTVPSLKSIAINYIVDYEKIDEVLNPKEDWDVDNSHLFNTRMTVQEIWDYLEEVLGGEKTFTQIKSEMREVLVQRPFDLDLVQLRAAIPLLFNHLPVVMAKEIWMESFLRQFEKRIPFCFYFKSHYGAPMYLKAVQCVADGCQNKDLMELIQQREKELQIDEIVLEWMIEMETIDK